jgi:pyruvate dehydrogenase E2 component (dihydrolipoamide acetyltransferase)
MAKEFRLQDPGEGVHEAEIVEIEVAAGDEVEDGDVVFVVETDKAAVEIPAPFTGTVEEVRVEEDELVEVGDVLLTYHDGEAEGGGARAGEAGGAEGEEEGEKEGKKKGENGPEDDEAEKKEAENGPEEEEEKGEKEESAAAASEDTPVPASPATRRLARELDVDLQQVPGSGPEGRVTSADVRDFAQEGPAEAEEAGEEAAAREEEEGEREGAPEETRAREETGEEAPALPFRTLVKKPPTLPDFSRWGPVRREPLRRIRRSVARRMTMAWWEVPHVTHQEVADITKLERFRKEHEEAVEEGGGQLTLTVLVLKAAVAALKEHPRFNASLDVDAEELVLKDYYNLGLAVDTPEGLVVPVIRDVDGKSLVELSREIPRVVGRVREGEATQEDLQGGTFTLTNPGPLGGTSFTPIVRHPEVAILGMAAARMEPVMVGDLVEWEIEARLRLPLILAFDHRVNDGADAARFMNTVVETLNDIDSLLLKI